MKNLIPSKDNSIEHDGAIGKQKCGIIFWQKTGFLRHCNYLGFQSIITLISKEFSPTNIQNKDNLRDIVDTSIIFNDQNDVIWSDDIFTNMSDLQDGSYVIAESMKWRIVNDSPKEAE